VKGKVFGLIVLATLGIGVMSYLGYLGNDHLIQVRGYYIPFACGDDNIDLKVTAVSDSSFYYLIGKTVSPEGTFSQTKLTGVINDKLQKTKANEGDEFIMLGYLRESPVKHCSGSVCFKVKKLKFASDVEFIEF
jgi:hypothetical protein